MLYLGKAAFSTHVGICHAVDINTIENDINIDTVSQEVIPFDFCKFSGDEFSIPGSQGLLSSNAERFKRFKESLYIYHLNEEEKNYILRWEDDYAYIFYLNGERLSSTHLMQH